MVRLCGGPPGQMARGRLPYDRVPDVPPSRGGSPDRRSVLSNRGLRGVPDVQGDLAGEGQVRQA